MLRLIQILTLVMAATLLSACGGQSSTSGTTASQPLTNNNSGDGVNLSWSAPSTRADGSYLSPSELVRYRVYMGTSSGNLTPLVDLDDETITQYTVSGLTAGSYYFAVTAFDADGLESGKSQVIMIQQG